MSQSCTLPCPICGGIGFDDHAVLWPELISAWQLSSSEVSYINRQQGTLCRQCGGNIRSGALAKAICTFLGFDGPLDQLLTTPPKKEILEVNEAGTLHSRLSRIIGHKYGAYPECNLMEIPYPDSSLQLVIHSDTLEHVESPRKALEELRRVLVKGGATIFTVPIVVGRLTHSRNGLPLAFHGVQGSESQDLCVHTEFGADVWCTIMDAGFGDCRFISYDYPSGVAITATK